MACGIFPDQGSNPCLLHWQADFITTELPREAPPFKFLLNECMNSIGTFEPSVSLRSKPVSLLSIWLYNSYLSLAGTPQN